MTLKYPRLERLRDNTALPIKISLDQHQIRSK